MSEELIEKNGEKQLVDDLKSAGQSIIDAQLIDEYEDERQIDYKVIIKRFEFIKRWSIATLVLFFLVFIPILIAWFVLEVNVDDSTISLQQKQAFGGITIGLIIFGIITFVFEVVQFFNKLWTIKIKKIHPKLNELIQFKYGIVVFILVGSISLLVYSNKSILILKNYLKHQEFLKKENKNEINKTPSDLTDKTQKSQNQDLDSNKSIDDAV